MKTSLLTLAFLLVCGLLPQSAMAAILAQTDNYAVITMPITAPTGGLDTEIPLYARNGIVYNDRTNTVGLGVRTDAGSVSTSTPIIGVVLGTEPIDKGRYQIASTTKQATFTLLAIVNTSDLVNGDYEFVFTKFPYWLNGNRTSVHFRQLDEFSTQPFTIE